MMFCYERRKGDVIRMGAHHVAAAIIEDTEWVTMNGAAQEWMLRVIRERLIEHITGKRPIGTEAWLETELMQDPK